MASHYHVRPAEAVAVAGYYRKICYPLSDQVFGDESQTVCSCAEALGIDSIFHYHVQPAAAVVAAGHWNACPVAACSVADCRRGCHPRSDQGELAAKCRSACSRSGTPGIDLYLIPYLSPYYHVQPAAAVVAAGHWNACPRAACSVADSSRNCHSLFDQGLAAGCRAACSRPGVPGTDLPYVFSCQRACQHSCLGGNQDAGRVGPRLIGMFQRSFSLWGW